MGDVQEKPRRKLSLAQIRINIHSSDAWWRWKRRHPKYEAHPIKSAYDAEAEYLFRTGYALGHAQGMRDFPRQAAIKAELDATREYHRKARVARKQRERAAEREAGEGSDAVR